jgi:hypothetical protein
VGRTSVGRTLLSVAFDFALDLALDLDLDFDVVFAPAFHHSTQFIRHRQTKPSSSAMVL